MSETFGLTYDPSNATAGLSKLSKYLDDAEREGREMGQAVARATTVVDTFGNQSSIAASKISTASKSMDQQQGVLQRTGKAAGGAREGLEKLAGAANYLGSDATRSVVQGMSAISGVMVATASPIGALAATVASGVVLFNEWNETVEQMADPLNTVDGIAITVSKSLGLINDEAADLAATLRKEQGATDEYAKKMEEATKSVKKTEDAIKAIGKSLKESREGFEIGQQVEAIDSISQAESEITRVMDRLDAVYTRVVTTLEERAAKEKELAELIPRTAKEVQALEQRRQQLIVQEKDAKKKAAEDEKRAAQEKAKKAEEDHKAELDRIAKESEEKKRAEDEEKKRLADLAKQKDDELTDRLARLKQEQGGEQQGDQQQAGTSQASTEQPNPYGEGEAPTAGQGGGFGDQLLNALGAARRNFEAGIADRGGVGRSSGGAPAGGVSDTAGGGNVVEDFAEQALGGVDRKDIIKEAIRRRFEQIDQAAAEELATLPENDNIRRDLVEKQTAAKKEAEERSIKGQLSGKGTRGADGKEESAEDRAKREEDLVGVQRDLATKQAEAELERSGASKETIDLVTKQIELLSKQAEMITEDRKAISELQAALGKANQQTDIARQIQTGSARAGRRMKGGGP